LQARWDILLVAVNARYSHCSHAARSLRANLGPLSDRAALLETDLDVTPLQLAEQVVGRSPRIVGFSVYLWNVRLVEAAARILRAVAPQLRLLAGGPELTPDYANAALFDAVVVGEGETAFRRLCESWLTETSQPAETQNAQRSTSNAQHPSLPHSLQPTADSLPSPTRPIIITDPENPATLALPYDLYTDTDLAQRTVYAEASRGCPYACAYCTSAGTGLRLIPLDRLLLALDRLWRRGLRRFKFLDRSFNAPAAHAAGVLDFFFARVTPDTSLHFEINPDHLHRDVASRIAAFPRGTLHLEAGVQTLDSRVAAAVGRSSDTRKTLDNLRFLTRQTGATVHADLIFGLPGEDEASFARGFDTLVETCAPQELQVNLLKGLPGTRLAREAAGIGLVFNPEPPYELLRSDAMDFETLLRLQRFARCWELIHNRGRFPNAVRALHAACDGDYYGTYQTLATRIHAEEGKLFALGLPRLSRLLHAHLTGACGIPSPDADSLLAADLNGKRS
jgi:radical SAM superfamily enzyme YgiQ (UPF0313 family)